MRAPFLPEIVLANEALDFSFIRQIIDGLAGLHKRFLRIPERAWPGQSAYFRFAFLIILQKALR
jgi:hypothetical protein